MPRPKSDLEPILVRLSPDHLAKLEAIAQREGLVASAGKTVGSPDRSQAIRFAIELAAKPQRKKQGNPI